MIPGLVALPSSCLAKASYDSRGEVLRIHFQDGTVYDYYAVPQSLFDSLLTAASKGLFFNRQIRDRFHQQQVMAEN